MDLFDDLGQRIGETFKVVEDTSRQVLETGRINLDIGREEAIIKKLYFQIGKEVYKAHCGEQETAQDIDGLCWEVKERKAKVAELRSSLKRMRG
ncbi:MAG TPA: hypothetical protein VFD57_04275 [Clostridia bacterium]|nr:hypothetical protein [Clostridia bacterium]